MRAILLFTASAAILSGTGNSGPLSRRVEYRACRRHGSCQEWPIQRRRAAGAQAHRSRSNATQPKWPSKVLGGTVTHRFETLVNGMAVTLTEQAAAQLRQKPNSGVYIQCMRHHIVARSRR